MADESLLDEFFADSQSHLESIEHNALKLEQHPSDAKLIDDVFRRVHSIKGNAGMLGLTQIHAQGQAFEEFLDNIRTRGTASAEELELVFKFLDDLKSKVGELQTGKKSGEKEDAPTEPGEEGQAGEKPTQPEAEERQTATAAEKSKGPPAPASGENGDEEEILTFLTFTLAEEQYGIDITKVREIICIEPITRVPNTKEFVDGVMNLRDQVIPVIDLKKKLNIPIETDNGSREDKNIIVVDISKVATGLKVDEVTGIKGFPVSKITPPSVFEGTMPTDYLYGIGQADNSNVILLDAMDLCDPNEILY